MVFVHGLWIPKMEAMSTRWRARSRLGHSISVQDGSFMEVSRNMKRRDVCEKSLQRECCPIPSILDWFWEESDERPILTGNWIQMRNLKIWREKCGSSYHCQAGLAKCMIVHQLVECTRTSLIASNWRNDPNWHRISTNMFVIAVQQVYMSWWHFRFGISCVDVRRSIKCFEARVRRPNFSRSDEIYRLDQEKGGYDMRCLTK